ncbi:MAG: hypothetical protein HYR91_04700 [Flavobacteriia bacterium]|nr:hypothetical protein [Flavobacteriia bacterium]
MRIFLTFICILSYHFGYSQKQLTLIIDTIDFIDDFDKYHFKVYLTNQGFSDLGEIDTNSQISSQNYPNFKTTINVKTDSTKIQIPIDKQNGVLELSNIYYLDTIRINHLEIYSNCYKDTVKTRLEYYSVKNDSISNEPYKVKFKKSIKKSTCKYKPPYKTMLTINGQKYYVSIQKKESNINYMHGHGYKPKQTEKNHEHYSGSKIYICSTTIHSINVITINIK